MFALALMGAATMASGPEASVARRMLSSTTLSATCVSPSGSTADCEDSFAAAKGGGAGYRTDCIGPDGSDTATCIYTAATLDPECGLLAHQRPGDTPEEKCEIAPGCKYIEGGVCVRNPNGAALEGMCDVSCPGGYVPKSNSQAIYVGNVPDEDKKNQCCERDVSQLFSAIDGDQDGSLTKTEATGKWAASNDMPAKVLMYLKGHWSVADANGDGTLSANELEVVYTDQMDVTLTATSRWLRKYCPEQWNSCNADANCYTTLATVPASTVATVGLRDIIDKDSVDLVDIQECVERKYRNDCVGEWSDCTADCGKTYKVTSPRDDLGIGHACEAVHNEEGTCDAADPDSGCHIILAESVYSLYQVGSNFDEIIPSYEWPDCMAGKTQQKFTFEVDVCAHAIHRRL